MKFKITKKNHSICMLLFFTILLISNSSYARWANHADATYETIFSNFVYNVNEDGTYEVTNEVKIKLLKETGRDCKSKQTLVYNSNVSKIQIISAKTIINGKEYPIEKDLIEDKPLASNINGFDQLHQILLAFPHAEVGAELYLKYKENFTKTIIKDLFNTSFYYGVDYLHNSKTTINSKLPLYLFINNQENYLEINKTETKNKQGYYSITFTLKRPVFNRIMDENFHNFNPKIFPSFSVSSYSEKEWVKYGQIHAENFAKKLNQKLPNLYLNIANLAKKETTIIDKINVITTELNDKIQYLGDWKSIDGKFVPRDLEKVAKDRFGDCKDYSAATVVILRHLGIEADVALVVRGEGEYPIEHNLPSPIFNHAITYVNYENKDYWIDATNFTSMADKIYPDIADKKTIILNTKNPRLSHTPKVDYTKNKVIYNEGIDLSEKNSAKISGEILLLGQQSIRYTGATKFTSTENIKNVLLSEVANFNKISDATVILPNLDSRIVKNLSFKYTLVERNKTIKTSSGLGMNINPINNAQFIIKEDKRSDLYLGTPSTFVKKIKLNNVKVIGNKNLDYALTTPWFDFKRTVKYMDKNVVIEYISMIKQDLIPNKVLKSTEYKNFQKEIEENIEGGIIIIFKN